ncbi:MAG: glycosyltransferase family 2 protein [Candidatus Marsarchaeota archaeon]|nr:glycosyltransferase family 2 protein [Candidatus Marsarchaeota archaeon]
MLEQAVTILMYVIAFITLYITVFYLLLTVEKKDEMQEKTTGVYTPSITVIIPCYNEEKVLSKTVDVLMKSDYPKNSLKVFLVDDGSRDGTFNEMKRLEKKYRNVRAFSKKNGGKSSAVNYGIKRADTELVATLDSDSYVHIKSLKKMTSFFKDAEVMAATSAIKVYKPRKIIEKVQHVEYLLTIVSRRLLSFLDSVTVTPGPLSVFRRRVFDEVGLFDETSLLEDQEIAYRIQAHNYRIVSSMNASVWTEVPQTLKALIRQRVRWNRGGLRNYWKYKKVLNPNYGDFGIMIFPLGLIGSIAVLAVFFISIVSLLNGSAMQFFKYGFEVFYYGFNALQVISIIIFVLSVLWIWVASKHLKEKMNPITIALYLVLYSFLITIFWIITIGEELTFKKQRW